MKKHLILFVLLVSVSFVYAQGFQYRGGTGREYNLAEIVIGLLALYLITYGLTRTKYLSLAGQRKIWNILLTISFLVTGTTGFLIAVRQDLGWDFSLIPAQSFWHIEFGIAMIVIAVFHALWHWKYYLGLFRKK